MLGRDRSSPAVTNKAGECPTDQKQETHTYLHKENKQVASFIVDLHEFLVSDGQLNLWLVSEALLLEPLHVW